jgi:hypothetical protein
VRGAWRLAAVGAAALVGLAACQPDYSSRQRSADAAFADGRGTRAFLRVLDTPSGQQNIYITVIQQFCDRSTDELVVRSSGAMGYDSGDETDDVEVDVASDLSRATAFLRTRTNITTERFDGCDADPDGTPISEGERSVGVEAHLEWRGRGAVRELDAQVAVRDGVARGVLRFDQPLGTVRVPRASGHLSAFEGIEE